jgi:hypothetical protein
MFGSGGMAWAVDAYNSPSKLSIPIKGIDRLTGMFRPVLSRRLMKFNGPSPIVTNGACPAPRDAVVHFAAIKAAAKFRLAHLILWVSREQRVRE